MRLAAAALVLVAFAPPAEASVPPDALAKAVESVVAPLAERDVFSGVVLVARGDEVLFEKAWGMANQEFSVPNRPDTRFRIASITKRFTMLLFQQLAAEKKLSLYDPLAKWAPAFPKADRITVSHLLNHKSGIRDPESLRRTIPASLTPEEVVALLATTPLASEPGETFFYTTANYAVLAYVLERVEGASFAAVIKRRLYAPAGMTDAGDLDTLSVVPRLASGYMPDPLAARGLAVSGPEDASWKVGGGSGYATARDLLRFHRALAAGKLLPAGTDPLAVFPPTKARGRRVISSSGAFPGANARTLWFPDDGVTVVVLSNNYANVTGPIADSAAAAAFGESVKPVEPPARGEAAPLDPRIAGSYLVESFPMPVTLEASHGKAVATWSASRVSALLRTGPDEWFMPLDWATLKLVAGEGGAPELVVTAPWIGKPIKVTRVPQKP